MIAYIVQRVAGALVVLLLLLALLALAVNLVPGDPATVMMREDATPALVAMARAELNLDESIPRQIWLFVSGVLQGDLGRDFITNEPVTAIIGRALPHSIVLAVSALIFATVIGLPLGVVSAVRPLPVVDQIITATSVLMITTPVFVTGVLLLLLFSVQFDILPALGSASLSDPSAYARSLIAPAVTLGAPWLGYFTRLTRAGMLEILGRPYIKPARALGLRQRTINIKYALRNALFPVIALLGTVLGSLIGGTVFVEVIFSRPGLGKALVAAIYARNLPVVRGVVIVGAVLYIVVNMLADVTYRWLDPRIRFT